MKEVLVPYTEFEAQQLALQMQEAVNNHAHILQLRNILGPVIRYGSGLDDAIKNVQKGQHEHATGELHHFAVVNHEDGKVNGAASIYPTLPLYRLRAPIKSGVASRFSFLRTGFPHANPNIHAWSADPDDLAHAYFELTKRADEANNAQWSGSPLVVEPFTDAWTIEPVSSPGEIHEAIVALSGLEEVTLGRFDDGEDKNAIPSFGMLYAKIHSIWESPRGKLKELRTGRHSWIGKVEQSLDDDVGRHA